MVAVFRRQVVLVAVLQVLMRTTAGRSTSALQEGRVHRHLCSLTVLLSSCQAHTTHDLHNINTNTTTTTTNNIHSPHRTPFLYISAYSGRKHCMHGLSPASLARRCQETSGKLRRITHSTPCI
ncbi:hypothetical protein E2C01_025299 [Portunus trituberculatus]|uniref:Secreted protein n=1 Tax=Portunus trituberculatus TaxID=210409 RepID=A0A5B7EF80_PORTR|nr:hypothetical protein [Portunus trituberculatus]